MQLNNKFTTIMSIISLIVSIVTLVLTSPVIIDIYLKPELVISEVNRELDGNTFRTMFILENNGRGTAKNIELVLNTHAKDLIQVMQGFTGESIEKDNGPSFKTVILKTPYLPLHGNIIVLITGSKESLISDSKAYNMEDKSPANLTIPAVVSIKSEKTLGIINNQVAWFQVNINKNLTKQRSQ